MQVNKLKGKGNNFFSNNKQQKKTSNVAASFDPATHAVIKLTDWEEYGFNDLVENNPDMRALIADGNKQIPTFKNLAQDIYSALWQPTPQLNQETLYPPFVVNKQLVETVMKLDQYFDMRQKTSNPLNSTIQNKQRAGEAAVKIADVILKLLTEQQKEQIRQACDKNEEDKKQKEEDKKNAEKEQQRKDNDESENGNESDASDSEGNESSEQGETSKQGEKGQDILGDAPQGTNEAKPGNNESNSQAGNEDVENGDGLDGNESQIPNDAGTEESENEDQRFEFEDWQSEESNNVNQGVLTEEEINAIRGMMRDTVSEAIETIDTDLQTEDDAMIAFGCKGAELTPVGYDEKMKIMKQLIANPLLKKVIEIAGNMKYIAHKINMSKTIETDEEIIGVTSGDDLNKILASEFALSDDEDTEYLFYSKLLNGELLEYEMEGKEPQGKGPIVILVDCSGSMAYGHGRISPEVWAKGVMIALVMLAIKEGRDVHICYFNEGIRKEFEILEGKIKDVEAWMQFVSLGANGGTNFKTPLSWALNKIKSSHRFKKADIIMISDGEALVTDDHYQIKRTWLDGFLKVKEELETKCFGFLIGGVAKQMNLFCDVTTCISDLNKADQAYSTMFSL